MNAICLIVLVLAGYAMWSLPVRNEVPSPQLDLAVGIIEGVCQGKPGDRGLSVLTEEPDRKEPHLGVGVGRLGCNDGEAFIPKGGKQDHGTRRWISASIDRRCKLRDYWGGFRAEGSQNVASLVREITSSECDAVYCGVVPNSVRQRLNHAVEQIFFPVVGEPLYQQREIIGAQDEQCFLSLSGVLTHPEPLGHREPLVPGLSSGEQSCEQADCEQGSANGDGELRPLAHEWSLAGCLGHFNSLRWDLTPSFDRQ